MTLYEAAKRLKILRAKPFRQATSSLLHFTFKIKPWLNFDSLMSSEGTSVKLSSSAFIIQTASAECKFFCFDINDFCLCIKVFTRSFNFCIINIYCLYL